MFFIFNSFRVAFVYCDLPQVSPAVIQVQALQAFCDYNGLSKNPEWLNNPVRIEYEKPRKNFGANE